MASSTVSIPTRSVASMSIEDKLAESIRRSEKYMPSELWTQISDQIQQLLKPESLAIMATITAAWAISHFYGVGEVADAVLLVVGYAAIGSGIFQAGREVFEFGIGATRAKSDADLDAAAQHFAKAIIGGGIQIVSALFFRAKPKILQDTSFGGPVRIPANGPRNGSLFYKPTVTIGQIPQRPGYFTSGTTDIWGNIIIESRLSKSDQAAVLLHEQVHAFLTPKFYLFRNVRIKIAMEGYNRSYLLRYLEEMLAQSYSEVRTRGLGGLPDGISFPVKNGYVTLAKMGQEVSGFFLGPINVGGNVYHVWFSAAPPQRSK